MAKNKSLEKVNEIGNFDLTSSFDANVGLNSHVSRIERDKRTN